MNVNRWAVAGACVMAVNALAVAWTSLQYRAHADFTQNGGHVSDAHGPAANSAEKKGSSVAPGEDANVANGGELSLDVQPPGALPGVLAPQSALPEVPSLTEKKRLSAEDLRNDPVFDELKKMFNSSRTLGPDLPDSSAAAQANANLSESKASASHLEALDRGWTIVEQLSMSTHGLISEALMLAKQGKGDQASAMLALASQTRDTMLQLIATLPKQ